MAVPVFHALPIAISILGLLYYCYRRCLCTPVPGIPHNTNAAYTLLGDVPEMMQVIKREGMLFPWIASSTVKHNSPITQVFLRPFSKPWVIVSDFRECQDILLRRTKEFDRSPATVEVFHGVAPEFLMNQLSDDKDFKYHKLLLRDLMTPDFLHHVAAPHVYASTLNLVRYWTLKAQLAQGHPFDAFDDVFNVLLDSITSVTFGLDINKGIIATRQQHLSGSSSPKTPGDIDKAVLFDVPPRPPTYEALVTLTKTISGTVQAPIPWLYHWVVSKLPFYRNAFHYKEEMINAELEKGIRRLKQGEVAEKCALDNVLQREWTAAKKADREPNLKSRVIFDELFGFLVAGEDTTGSTMAWGWKHLSANPQVQKTLRLHLQTAFNLAFKEDRDPTLEEVNKTTVPYLEATIEEIHRTAQILPMTIRRTTTDAMILGHKIPKGYDIGLAFAGPSFTSPAIDIPDSKRSESSLAAKQRYGSWDMTDIDQFKPERWLKTDEKGDEVFDATAGPQMAFSAGPRGCFGRRLAYMQMRILIVLIMWNLEMLEVKGELGSMQGVETLTKVPRVCYLKLKEVEK